MTLLILSKAAPSFSCIRAKWESSMNKNRLLKESSIPSDQDMWYSLSIPVLNLGLSTMWHCWCIACMRILWKKDKSRHSIYSCNDQMLMPFHLNLNAKYQSNVDY